MKSLLFGCAVAGLLMGLAAEAHAQIVLHDAPVQAVPTDEDNTPAAEPTAPAADKLESAPAGPLILPKAPPVPVLTPQENAFFAALGQRFTDAASAYETYVRRGGAIDPGSNGGASVQHAVKLAAAYQPHQLEEGIVAYAALIALGNPEFVDGVRAVQTPAFADRLTDHPERVMEVRGASAAAADAAGVLKAQGESLTAAGAAVTKSAFDIQAQSRSKSPVTNPKGMLNTAKASGDETRTATVSSKARLLDSLAVSPQPTSMSSAPGPGVVRGVALAALAVLGRTGDGNEAQFEALLDEPASAQCLKMAKLNLDQCLAVAGPPFRDAYCAGRHAVSDTGQCITAAAGDGGPALDAGPRLQEAEAGGPEQASVYGRPASRDEVDEDEGEAAPALAATPPPAPAPAPAPRQYAEAPSQRAEPMPDPRSYRDPQPTPAPAYAPPPQGYSYAQNSYAQNSYAQNNYPQNNYPQNTYAQPPAPYQRPAYQAYAQPQYPQTQPYQQAYAQPQPYPQQQYAPQPYQQSYAPPQASSAQSYGGQQPYYPQQQGHPAYQNGGYYGR